jgi:hypothetical protein
VGNCGPHCGWTTEELLVLLQQHGAVLRHHEGIATVCATFETSEQASSAVSSLDGHRKQPDAKPLIVKFADVSKHKVTNARAIT